MSDINTIDNTKTTNKKNTEFICTKCPMGCMLNLKINGEEIIVTGNTCKIGEKYGINEYKNPLRTITTSIKCNSNNGFKMISVKTTDDISKTLLNDCLKEIKKINLHLKDNENIKVGDVIIHNILNLNVDVVATRNS